MLAKSVGLPEFLHGGFVFKKGDEDCMTTILGDVKARAPRSGKAAESRQIPDLCCHEGFEVLGLGREDADADQIGVEGSCHGRFSLWGEP